MECHFCKGEMVKGSAPFSIDRKGYHLHWESVPAWVRNQCGEPYFESATVDAIQEAAKTLDQKSAELVAQ